MAKGMLEEQLQRGNAAIGQMLTYWLLRSGLSGRQFVSLVSWTTGGSGGLDSAQVSRICNDRLAKGCSLRNLLALEAVNEAIWLWQEKGSSCAWERFGSKDLYGIRAEWLEKAIWLPVPGALHKPLQLSHFTEVLAGRLELPYVCSESIPDRPSLTRDALCKVAEAVRLVRSLPPGSYGPGELARELVLESPENPPTNTNVHLLPNF